MACMRALQRVLERDFRFLKLRGMRVTRVDDNVVVLEDLDEWLSTYQETLHAKCPGQLTFNVHAQPTDHTMHMSSFRISIQTEDSHWSLRALHYALASFSVFLFVCWMHAVYRHDVGALRTLLHSSIGLPQP